MTSDQSRGADSMVRNSDLERGAIAPTPGPWAVREGRHIFAAAGQVASVYGDVYIRMPESEHAANARLIAAAPELLRRLEECATHIAAINGDSDPYAQAAFAAIARATHPS